MNSANNSAEKLANEVWVLTGEKAGDNDQAVELARSLGCPFRIVKLSYNQGFRVPNALLGATTWTLRDGRDEFRAPWPKVVIGTGRRSVPIARFIKKASGERSRIVRIGRPRADLESFDLVVTTPQYRLPPAPNVHCLSLPISSRSAPTLNACETRDALVSTPARTLVSPSERLKEIVVMIGGDSDLYRFDTEAAADLGKRLKELALAEKRRLFICYGRRVQPDAADVLDSSVGSCLAKSHRFTDCGGNPYSRLLALGEMFVVSTDSASMMGDAIRRGRSVFLYPAKFRPNVIYASRLWIDRYLEQALGPERWAAWVAKGFYVPVKRMDILVEQIAHSHGIGILGDPASCLPKQPPSMELDCIHSKLKAWLD